jgi:hypothetical protein
VDDLADLADFDEVLRRVGRDDEDVGVGLDEDAGFALVGFAEVVAGGEGFGDAGFEVGGLADALAVAADAAVVGRPSDSVGLRQLMRRANIRASVYLPAPRGPARMMACGMRWCRTLSRRRSTVCGLPRNCWKPMRLRLAEKIVRQCERGEEQFQKGEEKEIKMAGGGVGGLYFSLYLADNKIDNFDLRVR